MSQDDFYRGDPPPYAPAPQYAPPPQYGPAPQYGPPPGYGPAYAPGYRPVQPPTNSLAVAGLVLSFLGLLAPVGLVLGVVARGQIRRTGERGDGLALAAIIVGGIISTLQVIGIVFWVFVLTAIGDGVVSP